VQEYVGFQFYILEQNYIDVANRIIVDILLGFHRFVFFLFFNFAHLFPLLFNQSVLFYG